MKKVTDWIDWNYLLLTGALKMSQQLTKKYSI